jgi:CRISPR system Cascade subunit CasB
MTKSEPRAQVTVFVQRLAALEPGDRARLKRSAGRSLAESRAALGLFYRLLPAGVPEREEETYFLVATLYPLVDAGGEGNLGGALRRARNPQNAKGIDRRFEILLDSDAAQLRFRLRQSVHLLQSVRQPVDWTTLLNDLLYWEHPDRSVQKRWARSFFGNDN